ncbi:CAZyme family GH3 [Penicillium atrosanguineum]|nr:CAZyme family GH3 [Penicillium atrosanguineum]
MTRPSGGTGASTRRQGYSSVNNDISDDESLLVSEDSFEDLRHGKGARVEDFSSGSEDEDNVKLLPVSKDKQYEAASSSRTNLPMEDVPENDQDVGLRIEQVLERERKSMLGESFDTDLEDGHSNLVLSDDDDDYGVPLVKGSRGSRDEGGVVLRSGLRGLIPLTKWWHAIPLGLAAIAVMWLAMQGLYWLRSERPRKDYESVPWYPTPLGGTGAAWKESYDKAHDMVERMTLIEKVNVTTGTGWQMGLCVGNTGAAAITGFPSLCLQDGPLGLRYAQNITAFPAGITTGATWNRELMLERGLAMGLEARNKGVNVILGPSMGALGMNPAGGRNWESFGSDPVLQAVAAAETIRGIQRNGVMATAKHFVMNEQEHFRQPYEWGIPTALSSNIDDRTLHEVFIWPFAESIRADVASVMCAYQQVNNSHACENSKLLNGILKDELGFQGFVQSDWLAQRSGVQSALSGLDMSMPGDGLKWADGDSLWGPHLTRAALNTSVPMNRINDMVTRIVAAWFHFRQDNWHRPPPESDGGPNFSSWTTEKIGSLHPGSPDDLSKEVVNHFVDVAAEGTVLLKNIDNTLPFDRNVSKSERRYRVGVYGEDAGPGQGPNVCPDRGCNQGTLAEGWGSGAVDFPYLVTPWDALQTAWNSETVDIRGYLTNAVAEQDVEEQDLCVVFANSDGGEGFIKNDGVNGDRNDLFLQRNGVALIERVARRCGGGHGKTVVVVHSIGPVVLGPWIDFPGVHAVVYANLPGQESGNALADVLFGDVDASGRLPYTIGHSLEDYGPGAQVLYETGDPVPQVTFQQGLYIDYRYFDRHNITPRYEFGFGLSYTTFEFSSLKIHPVQEKSRLPKSRPKDAADPPHYDEAPGNPSDSLVPAGFKLLGKYIYPYLLSHAGTKPGSYPYPEGYKTKRTPSAAGGGPGGNPFLYEAMLELSMQVTNTGTRTGKEVVQIYVSFPDEVAEHRGLGWDREAIDFPERVLRNFSKIELSPGETKTVNMTLSRKDLSYWSVRAQNWVLPTEGKFRIWAGKSSRDLPLVAEY